MNNQLDKILMQLSLQQKRKQIGLQIAEPAGIMFGINAEGELSSQDLEAINNIADGLLELETIKSNEVIYLDAKALSNYSFNDGSLLVITNIDELLFSNDSKQIISFFEFIYNNYGKNAIMLLGSQKAFNKIKEIDSSCYEKIKM